MCKIYNLMLLVGKLKKKCSLFLWLDRNFFCSKLFFHQNVCVCLCVRAHKTSWVDQKICSHHN